MNKHKWKDDIEIDYIFMHMHTHMGTYTVQIYAHAFPFKYISWVKSIYCTCFLLLISLNIISLSIIHLVSISFPFFKFLQWVYLFIFLAHLFLRSTKQNTIIGGQLLYNIVLASATHPHESATGIQMSPPSRTVLPSSPPSHPPRPRLSQDTGLSSL